MNDQVDAPTRQAGAIYFKHLVGCFWADAEVTDVRDAANQKFSIHEQDRYVSQAAMTQRHVLLCG